MPLPESETLTSFPSYARAENVTESVDAHEGRNKYTPFDAAAEEGIEPASIADIKLNTFIVDFIYSGGSEQR